MAPPDPATHEGTWDDEELPDPYRQEDAPVTPGDGAIETESEE